MENNEKLIYEIKFNSFADRFFNNSHFKILFFLEFLLFIIANFLFYYEAYFSSLIVILIIIIRTYLNKYKIQFYKNHIQIQDLKFLGGHKIFKKNYEQIIGFNIKNEKNLYIYYIINADEINETKIQRLEKEELKEIIKIFSNKKIKELTFEESKILFKETINYNLFIKIIPIFLLISIIVFTIILGIIYIFL